MKNSHDKCVKTLIKAKNTLFIFRQHEQPIMEDETSRNKIIRRKSIFDHWEPPPALPKVCYRPNVPIFFQIKNII
jgi:hypothetical protein